MTYRLDGHGRPHGPVSNVQKLTTRNDIYWDGETTFSIAFPVFYVEARDYKPQTRRNRDRQDMMGWPSPQWPDGSSQKRIDWREKETMHARHLGEHHDGVQFMPTPFGLACTGRDHLCHDYAPRGRHRRDRICVNCIHHVIPIPLWEEYYRTGQMRIYSLPSRYERIHEEYNRWRADIDDVFIGDDALNHKGIPRNQHIVRAHLSELESEMDPFGLDLWYDVKIRAPYIYAKNKDDIIEGGYGGPPNPPEGYKLVFRPRTDTVAKGRIFIDPSVVNRLPFEQNPPVEKTDRMIDDGRLTPDPLEDKGDE